jgi:hypothetical protein
MLWDLIILKIAAILRYHDCEGLWTAVDRSRMQITQLGTMTTAQCLQWGLGSLVTWNNMEFQKCLINPNSRYNVQNGLVSKDGS